MGCSLLLAADPTSGIYNFCVCHLLIFVLVVFFFYYEIGYGSLYLPFHLQDPPPSISLVKYHFSSPENVDAIEYQLSTPEDIDVVQMTNFYRKIETSFFDPHLTPRYKMNIPKHYCTCTRHTQ